MNVLLCDEIKNAHEFARCPQGNFKRREASYDAEMKAIRYRKDRCIWIVRERNCTAMSVCIYTSGGCCSYLWRNSPIGGFQPSC